MPVKPKRRRRADHPFLLKNVFIGDMLNIRHAGWTNDRWKKFPLDVIRTKEELREAWELNRDELMQLKTKDPATEHGRTPGTMPPCWWLFEADEPLRILDTVKVKRRHLDDEGEWKTVTETDPIHETQAAYMARLGLLVDGEQELIDNEPPRPGVNEPYPSPSSREYHRVQDALRAYAKRESD